MEIKNNLKELVKITFKEGPVKSYRALKLKLSRHHGPKELNRLEEINKFLIDSGFIKEHQKSKTDVTDKVSDNEKNIFIFWYEGFASAPAVVKRCVKRLETYYGDKYKINLLDKTNYLNYVDLDNYVIDLFKKRKISIQTFTDIIRAKLIFDNGGYWIDSTFFMSKDFPLFQNLERNSFDCLFVKLPKPSMLKLGNYENPTLSFFLGGRMNSVLFKYLYDAFLFYLKDKKMSKKLIPYYYMDMMLLLAMYHQIDNGAVNKVIHYEYDLYYFQDHEFDTDFDKKEIDKMLSRPYKLNWRINPPEKSLINYIINEVED